MQLRPVKVVRYEADSVLVTGVAEGDQIVLLGVHKLEAGRKVRLIGRPI